jgi:scyllo-inositol 2-dehydrogenase (NADP+)
VRYLLVGLGNIGRKRQALLGDHCVATADPFNNEADFETAEECPVDTYDAAVLATPNSLKLRLLESFLENGKHVLVEKPLLLPDAETAARLQRLARQHHVVCYTSYNHRYETLIERAQQHLASGRIGSIYHGRLSYGNGTVGNVVGTWRDQGLGVLEDLGSHLLDLSAELLGRRGDLFKPVSLERHEATSFDHCVFTSNDGRIVLEASYLSWRNTFTIDVFGSRGSLHLVGLQKWGPSQLILRERVFPSGVPVEVEEQAPGGVDPTWSRDIDHFEQLCAADSPSTSLDNDWWISQTLHTVAGA